MDELDETIEGWLAEQVTGADASARESHRFAMNSYGAGYDAGYLAALKGVQEKLQELWGYPVAAKRGV